MDNQKNKKIKFEIKSDNYIDDKEIFIAIDGNTDNQLDVKDIKEMYEKYGEKIVDRIDGFFSIYIFDKKKEELLLIKDAIGLKHIYYCVTDNVVYCGNDLMDLINTYNLEKKINIDALSIYFRFHYINPPQTIIKNVYKLDHGHYLIYKDNRIEEKIYWNTIEKYNSNSRKLEKNFDIAKKTINDYLVNFIKKHTEKENNYGIYLSGGIDSSLVSAIYMKHSNKKVDTFSIGFFDDEINEAENSKKIAEYLGTNHHELYITEEKALEAIKKIPLYYTEPFADSSEIPTIILNEFAKKNNINIAFTGDGADQLFCGCTINDAIWKSQKYYKFLNPLHIRISPKLLNYKRKLIYTFSNYDKRYQAQCDILCNELYFEGLFKDEGQKRFEQEKDIDTNNWQEKRLILDFDTFACGRLSTKMGIAANKNNIEIRSPFYDRELIEYSFKVPHKYKYYFKNKKYILKQILFDYIPKEYFSDEKKGFGVPTQKWLKTFLFTDMKRLANKELIENQGIFNYEKVESLITRIDNVRVANVLWDFYIFQIWYEKHMLK